MEAVHDGDCWVDGRARKSTEQVEIDQVRATMMDNFKTFEDHLGEGMNKIERKMDKNTVQFEVKV